MDGKAFITAVKSITEEKGINDDIVYEAMEQALMTAYKKNFGSKTNVKVTIDRQTGDIKVFSYLVVVDEYIEGEEIVDEEGNISYTEPEINEDAQILLEDAVELVPEIKVGETIEEEVTPKDFGRVAASTAKQVLTQKIREAERNNIVSEYGDKQDEMVSGTVEMEDVRNYYIELGRTQGILPKTEIIPGEIVQYPCGIRETVGLKRRRNFFRYGCKPATNPCFFKRHSAAQKAFFGRIVIHYHEPCRVP